VSAGKEILVAPFKLFCTVKRSLAVSLIIFRLSWLVFGALGLTFGIEVEELRVFDVSMGVAVSVLRVNE
jgi:preprotein translocase subunit SecF